VLLIVASWNDKDKSNGETSIAGRLPGRGASDECGLELLSPSSLAVSGSSASGDSSSVSSSPSTTPSSSSSRSSKSALSCSAGSRSSDPSIGRAGTLLNEPERRRRESFAGGDTGDIGGSDGIGYCGCRVIMAGDRRADTPSMENLVGRGVGAGREVVARMGGNPGVKEAG
jgi:hypothetical protein